MSLLADDTTIVGRRDTKIVKKIMEKFEENNDDKKEKLVLGSEEGNKIRMLDSWIGSRRISRIGRKEQIRYDLE